MKDYCTQNNGNCFSCSLANYGRDCLNFQLEEEEEFVECYDD